MSVYRVIPALFLVVATAAAASAQALLPSVWRSERGALLKVLYGDPGIGNFSGVFLSDPSAPCPVVPYNLAGRIRGPWVGFETSRTWTPDCSVTAVWRGRFVTPTTIVARWTATSVGPNGGVIRTHGREVFNRM
jgi:hypothetical protein